MKENLPATSRKAEVPPGVKLISKTDLQGVITSANEALCEVSGYSLDELLHTQHSKLRHPDMPEAIFAQMWATLQRGHLWRGMLKNRCKDGGYYWVDASVAPIRRHDRVMGYMSVCKRASADAVAAAEALHARLAAGYKPRRLHLPRWLGVRGGMRAGSLFVAVLMLAGGALGMGGLTLADRAFSRLYHGQLEPVAAIGAIEVGLHESRATMLEIRLARNGGVQPAANGRPSELEAQIAKLRSNRDDILQLLDQLKDTTEEVAQQKAWLVQALTYYTNDGLLRVELAAAHDDSAQVDQLVAQRVLPLEQQAMAAAVDLRYALLNAAKAEYQDTLERNARIRYFAAAGIALGLLVLALVGHLFIRSIVDPLNASIRRFNRIAQGDLQGEMDLSDSGESGQLNHAAAIMQLHLKVMLDEIAVAARRIHRHCATLNATLYGVTEHSEEQHERVYGAIRALDAFTVETSDLSARAERLLQLASQQESPGAGESLVQDARELATATRLAAFGTEEVARSMHQVAELIVENRGEAQRAWLASEALKQTAGELKLLLDYFELPAPAP
ncbi:PAS domain-containing protein [Comamonas sp. GB3 AK4-5]|uniref:methyl-accepting chemotaxis protein n=1 Tax=Comamonas sp. GB3 AK4-5 TaxID=3231487 RepID=UPI00351EF252